MNSDEAQVSKTITRSLDVTATFGAGYALERYFGPGGSVAVSPDKTAYMDGEVVTLTATPDAGSDFVGWGIDASGAAASLNLTMDGHKDVSAGFRPQNYSSLPTLDSVDHPYVPIGGTMTFTGTGLTGVQAVDMFWHSARDAAFSELGDTSLEVVFPPISQSFRDQYVFVQTAGGSALQILPGSLDFIAGDDPASLFSHHGPLMVKAGAKLELGRESDQFFPIMVEAGGVLCLTGEQDRPVIFLEAGAILDLRLMTEMDGGDVFHSEGAGIWGEIPDPGVPPFFPGPDFLEVPPVRPSYGLPALSEGCELIVDVEGPGSVTANPDQTYFKRFSTVELVATPDAGASFIRWTGDYLGRGATASFSVGSSCSVKARFSDRPEFFTTWREQHFTAEELAQQNVSGLSADPDGDGLTNTAEYAFGTDPRSPTPGVDLSFAPDPDDNTRGLLTYRRPVAAADVDYIINASDDITTYVSSDDPSAWFAISEIETTPDGEGFEKVTVELSSEGPLPGSLFFSISAFVL